MSTGCVVLAAGGSARLGQPKQLVRLQGETLLDRAVRIAGEAGCAPIVVVLGANADVILSVCGLAGVEIVHNHNWAEGMASSLRVGVQALEGRAEQVVVMTCDQPAVTARHLRKIAELCRQQAASVASFYVGRKGVPACFPARIAADLVALTGDRGARSLLADAASVELLEGDLDIDTPELLERARRRYEDSTICSSSSS